METLVYFIAIWYILCPFGIFCVHLVYFVSIWYILWPMGIFSWPLGIFNGYLVYFKYIGIFLPFLVCYTEKNMATLIGCEATLFTFMTMV
jgi:hypothetical protein